MSPVLVVFLIYCFGGKPSFFHELMCFMSAFYPVPVLTVLILTSVVTTAATELLVYTIHEYHKSNH